jgi:hypothetical protein
MFVSAIASRADSLNIERDVVLLMTATIDIKGMPNAYPTVAEQRQEDYYRSLRYYVTHHPRLKKIVFVENSGWPLDRVREAIEENPHRKRVEFVSLNCNDFPRVFGKGYGESLLMERGILLSELVKESKYIAKITGRIYLQNLTTILESFNTYHQCFCDFKEPYYKRLTRDSQAISYADTRFLVFSRSFYTRYLQQMHNTHREGCFYSEHQYRRAIELASRSTPVLCRFRVEPKFAGIAGHFHGKNYSGPSERVKFQIRSLCRFWLPWLYL